MDSPRAQILLVTERQSWQVPERDPGYSDTHGPENRAGELKVGDFVEGPPRRLVVASHPYRTERAT